MISFRIDWFDLLAVQGTQESSPGPHFESISSLALILLYVLTLTSVHDYRKIIALTIQTFSLYIGHNGGLYECSVFDDESFYRN